MKRRVYITDCGAGGQPLYDVEVFVRVYWIRVCALAALNTQPIIAAARRFGAQFLLRVLQPWKCVVRCGIWRPPPITGPKRAFA